MTKSEYTIAHSVLCEINKHCLRSLDLIAKMDSYVDALERRIEDLYNKPTRSTDK